MAVRPIHAESNSQRKPNLARQRNSSLPRPGRHASEQILRHPYRLRMTPGGCKTCNESIIQLKQAAATNNRVYPPHTRHPERIWSRRIRSAADRNTLEQRILSGEFGRPVQIPSLTQRLHSFISSFRHLAAGIRSVPGCGMLKGRNCPIVSLGFVLHPHLPGRQNHLSLRLWGAEAG